MTVKYVAASIVYCLVVLQLSAVLCSTTKVIYKVTLFRINCKAREADLCAMSDQRLEIDQYSAELVSAAHYGTVQCSAVQCLSVQHIMAQCSAVQ